MKRSIVVCGLMLGLAWLPACEEKEEKPPPVPGATSGGGGGMGGRGTSGGSASGTSGNTSNSTSGGNTGLTTATASASASASATASASGSGTGGAGVVGDGSWIVGNDGRLVLVDADTAGDQEFEDPADLRAIACRGEETAWVVGREGTLLHTTDAGGQWTAIDVPSNATLRAVALAGNEAIFVAGEGGTLLVSRDGGRRFRAVDAPMVDFTGVATASKGRPAFATSSDGWIWVVQHDDQGVAPQFEAPAALSAIAVDPDGQRVIAVGDAGVWVESTDGGRSWAERDVSTDRSLYAVAIGADGHQALAVGEAGVIVRIEDGLATVQEVLDPQTHLRALHISERGYAVAVGDAGVMFVSDQETRRWTPLGLPTTYDLFGVDEIGLYAR